MLFGSFDLRHGNAEALAIVDVQTHLAVDVADDSGSLL